MLILIATVLLASQSQAPAQAAKGCKPQPMPAAIDAAGRVPIASDMIEFAATPSLEHPGRAWVVRLSRRGQVEATIEVVRLRRQHDCNRYDIERRWQSPLSQAEYLDLAAKAVAVGVPHPATFVPSSTGQPPDLVLDGTAIDLRLTGQGWQITRSLNHYGQGVAISAIFRNLASKYVPASELPAEDWRTLP